MFNGKNLMLPVLHPGNPTSPRRAWLGFSLCLVIFIALRLGLSVGRPLPAERPRLLESDMGVYVFAMLQADDPSYLARDTLWENGIATEFYNRYASLYMPGLRFFYRLSGEQIDHTLGLYSLAVQTAYLIAMFGLSFAWLRHGLASLIITFVSLKVTYFIGTGNIWGIPNNILLPMYLQMTVGVWLAWAGYHLWGGEHPPHHWAWPFLLGGVAGLTAARISVITGLALLHWMSALLLLQVLRRVLPWQVLAVWLVAAGSVFGLFYGVLGLAGNAAHGQLTWPASQAVISSAGTSMVFPWRLEYYIDLPRDALSLFFCAHLLLTLALAYQHYRKPQPLTLFLLVSLQYVFAAFLLNLGWLPVLMIPYTAWRLMGGRWRGRDSLLVMAFTWPLIVGFTLQIFLFYAWQVGHITQLTSILFEWARLSIFAYLPFYLLMGQAMLEVSQLFARRWLQVTILISLGLLVWSTVGEVISIRPNSDGTLALFLVGLSGVLVALLGRLMPQQLIPRLASISAGIIIGAGLLAWFYPDYTLYSFGHWPSTYFEMTIWVRQHTPSDSLFYLSSNDDDSFRYEARRSLLSPGNEWPMALYLDLDPLALRDLNLQLEAAKSASESLLTLLQQHQVDYVVIGPDQFPLEDQRIRLVYENGDYQVYQLVVGKEIE